MTLLALLVIGLRVFFNVFAYQDTGMPMYKYRGSNICNTCVAKTNNNHEPHVLFLHTIHDPWHQQVHCDSETLSLAAVLLYAGESGARRRESSTEHSWADQEAGEEWEEDTTADTGVNRTSKASEWHNDGSLEWYICELTVLLMLNVASQSEYGCEHLMK